MRTVPRLARRTLSQAADLSDGLRRLASALENAAAGPLRLEVSLARPASAVDLPAGFADGSLSPLILAGADWSGAGLAWGCEVETPDSLPSPVEATGEDLRLALSVRFDPAREDVAQEWNDFGRCRLWLPAIVYDAVTSRLAVNIGSSDASQRRRVLAAIAAWRPRQVMAKALLSVAWDDATEARRRWRDQVDDALSRLERGLGKVVLARRQGGLIAGDPHPADLLTHRPLGEGGWPWWLARGGRHWLGETPERLGRRDGRRLRTVALAGTRRRGATPAEDEALGRELWSSDKDRREQEAVAAWLRKRLALATGATPREGELELVRLPALQHLGRRLEATAAGPLRERDWLPKLHPTPALCGAPRRQARAWLRAQETFDRGLYGGALGWVEEERAEVSVTIRGLLVSGREVVAYAGCGLVLGSEAAGEWRETEAKLAALCRRLGLAAPPLGGET